VNQQYPYYYQPYQPASYPYYYPTTSVAYYPQEQTQQIYRRQDNLQQTNEQEMLPMEQSYIENILRLNRGKHVTVYMTIERETKTFSGTIEAAGRDHIIISDPDTGKHYLLLMVYLDYVVFTEKINYEYSFNGTQSQFSTYPQR